MGHWGGAFTLLFDPGGSLASRLKALEIFRHLVCMQVGVHNHDDRGIRRFRADHHVGAVFGWLRQHESVRERRVLLLARRDRVLLRHHPLGIAHRRRKQLLLMRHGRCREPEFRDLLSEAGRAKGPFPCVSPRGRGGEGVEDPRPQWSTGQATSGPRTTSSPTGR